jgi:hypothetical protein
MAQSLPFAPGDPRGGGPQRRHRQRGEGIQYTGARRLVRNPCPPPCRGKRRIRPKAGVALRAGGTVREYTDHDVEQFLVGRVEDGLAAELDMRPQRREESMAG